MQTWNYTRSNGGLKQGNCSGLLQVKQTVSSPLESLKAVTREWHKLRNDIVRVEHLNANTLKLA